MDNLSVLKDFPDNFTFGAATSSYQIEGNSYGKCGKSIWDEFAQKKLKGIDGLKALYYEKDDYLDELSKQFSEPENGETLLKLD